LFLGYSEHSDSEADLQDVGSAARGQKSEAANSGPGAAAIALPDRSIPPTAIHFIDLSPQ
jgi:hypothetical protein